MRRIAVAAMCACLTGAVPSNRISIDVSDASIGDTIALLGTESGVNVVADASLRAQKITIRLSNVTFDDALKAIVDANGLTVHRVGQIVIVGSASTAASIGKTVVVILRNAQPEEIAKELSDGGGLAVQVVADRRTHSLVISGSSPNVDRAVSFARTLDAEPSVEAPPAAQSYTLRFLKPDDVVAKLKTLMAEGSFLADSDQNAVLVTGPDRVQAAARSIIATLDVASAQVMFEVKVADVTPVNDSSNVGLIFGGLDVTGMPTPSSTTWAFTSGTIPVSVQLNAMISKGNASILATPKLVTLNNREADLSIGQTYPIVYSTSVFGGQNVQYVDVGVHLRLTPTIGSDGSVTAELHPEYSELIGYTSTGYPIVATRKIDSVLRVHDDETIVLGGLVRDASTETISKIPGLSAIPVIGKLFDNKQTTRERDEIVFLITPHVIYPGAAPAK